MAEGKPVPICPLFFDFSSACFACVNGDGVEEDGDEDKEFEAEFSKFLVTFLRLRLFPWGVLFVNLVCSFEDSEFL